MKRFDVKFTFQASESFFDIDAENDEVALDLAYEQLLNKYPDLAEDMVIIEEYADETDPND